MTILTSRVCEHCGADLKGCEGVECDYTDLGFGTTLLCAQCAENKVELMKRIWHEVGGLSELAAGLRLAVTQAKETNKKLGNMPKTREWTRVNLEYLRDIEDEFADVFTGIHEVDNLIAELTYKNLED
jgi:hypothetical protein